MIAGCPRQGKSRGLTKRLHLSGAGFSLCPFVSLGRENIQAASLCYFGVRQTELLPGLLGARQLAAELRWVHAVFRDFA